MKRFKKPILIMEVGFPGVKNGDKKPFEWRNPGPSDEVAQANAYRSTFQAIQDSPFIQGVFVWRKLASSSKKMRTYNKNETGYALWKRKAWHEIHYFFTRY